MPHDIIDNRELYLADAVRGMCSQKPALEGAINRLESLAFEHKLDIVAERHAEVAQLVTEPAIICTEAFL